MTTNDPADKSVEKKVNVVEERVAVSNDGAVEPDDCIAGRVWCKSAESCGNRHENCSASRPVGLAMDGSAFESSSSHEPPTCEEWVAIVCRYFESWGLSDRRIARIAAERVMNAVGSPSRFRDGEPVRTATRWIRAFVDDGSGSADWFFRAPSLLARFPAAFLETEIPPGSGVGSLSLLPELAPRAMPEQEIIGPIAHAVRAAAKVIEDAAPSFQQSAVDPLSGPFMS